MSLATVLENDCVRNRALPISVAQYHKIGELGLIAEKTELIEGVIIAKMTKSPLHEYIAARLHDFFSRRLPPEYWVRKEGPLTLAASEPEPDLSIVKGRIKDFIGAHPQHAELVVEVAISSLELDREKAQIYAAAGVPEYWIVIPEADCVERYREPLDGKYRTVQTEKQAIETLCGKLELRDLLQI